MALNKNIAFLLIGKKNDQLKPGAFRPMYNIII